MTDEQQQPIAARSEEFGEFSLPLATEVVVPGSVGLSGAVRTADAIRAVRGRWDIPDEVREQLPESLFRTAVSGGRNSVGAAMALIEIVRQQDEAESAVVSGGGDVVIFLPDNGRGL